MASTLPHLFTNNREWSARIRQQSPGFFEQLAQLQAPQHLWIGCSDSRVPANEIVGLQPGELFVHRNVANLVIHTDMNCLSVLQYAIDILHVRHVIVCGHYGCGGIRAALEDGSHGLIDNWLRHVQDLARSHAGELNALTDPAQRVDRLCELNVVAQAVNVGNTTVVQDAWKRGDPVTIHGWIYGLTNGLLHDLKVALASPDDVRRHAP